MNNKDSENTIKSIFKKYSRDYFNDIDLSMEKCLNENTFNDAINEALNLLCVSKQRELLIAFGKKVSSDMLRSDKIMNVEDSFDEFKSNL